MPKNKILYLFLFLIFLLAFTLRIHRLGTVPLSLHDDEVANTYVGRFIIENGRDLYGNKWPFLYFDKFGDYTPVLPMYLSGLGSVIFGNNEFGSRILIAVTGSLLIFPMYFLSKIVFRDEKTALFSAFLTAILPWHIVLSRVNAEGIVGLMFFSTALLFLFLSLKRKSTKALIISLPILFLCYFLYISYRIIIPLALLAFLAVIHKKGNKIYGSVFIVGVILSLLLTLYISSTTWGKGRFEQVSLFNKVSGVQIKTQSLIFNETDIRIARIFNNKFIGFGREFLNQYLQYFSPAYLFSQESLIKVYAVPNNGLLYFFILGLIIYALIPAGHHLFSKIDKPLFLYLCCLLLISPLSSAMTVIDTPNMHRSLPMSIFLILIASYGFFKLNGIKHYRIPVNFLLFLIIGLELINFSHNYFQHASFYRSAWSNEANKNLVDYLLGNKDKYDTIHITGDGGWLPVYYLYYKNDFEKKYIGQFGKDFKISRIDNLKFGYGACPSEQIYKNTESIDARSLIVDAGQCTLLPGFKEVKSFPRINFTKAFNLRIPTSTQSAAYSFADNLKY